VESGAGGRGAEQRDPNHRPGAGPGDLGVRACGGAGQGCFLERREGTAHGMEGKPRPSPPVKGCPGWGDDASVSEETCSKAATG